MKKKAVWIPVLSLICFSVVFWVTDVVANRVENAFAGKVVILKKRPPTYFKSQGGFVKYLRSNALKTVHENTDKTWTFQTMAFFKRPLGDYEVEVVFYDISRGSGKSQRRFVNSYPQFTQDRNTRSLSAKTKLIRPDFDANKRYQIVFQHRGKEIAKGQFETRGTSQQSIDSQKRVEAAQKEMEKSMKDLERRAKEQEEREKRSKKAADNLF